MTTRENPLAAIRLPLSTLGRVSPELAGRVAGRLFTSPRRYQRPAAERALLATGAPFALSADGEALAAWSWGEGPTVLLVHGWQGRGAQLGALVEPLVELGHRVVAFDAPAHGDSPGRAITLAGFASVVEAAARAAGSLHAIVAHSFGAAAVTIALSRGTAAERVAFIAPLVSAHAATGAFVAGAGLGRAAAAAFVRRLEYLNGARIDEIDGVRLAPSLRAPLLVVHDHDDRETPFAAARALTAVWPRSQLLPTRGLGHRRILRSELTVSAVTRFLLDDPSVGIPANSEQTLLERSLWDRESRRREAFP